MRNCHGAGTPLLSRHCPPSSLFFFSHTASSPETRTGAHLLSLTHLICTVFFISWTPVVTDFFLNITAEYFFPYHGARYYSFSHMLLPLFHFQARVLAEKSMLIERSPAAVHLYGVCCVAIALDQRGLHDRGTWSARGIEHLRECVVFLSL